MTEQAVQKQILDYLKIRGVVAWKNHIDRRRYQVGMVGAPDIVGYLPGGRFLAIEVKRPKGGSVSAAQDEWIERAMTAGCCAFIARSVDEVREIVEMEIA